MGPPDAPLFPGEGRSGSDREPVPAAVRATGHRSMEVSLDSGAVTVPADRVIGRDEIPRGRRRSRLRASRVNRRATAPGGARRRLRRMPHPERRARHRAPAPSRRSSPETPEPAEPDRELDSYLAALSGDGDEDASERTGRFGTAQVFQLRLPALRIEQLRRIAADRGVSPGALAVDWVIERLDHEDAATGPLPPVVEDEEGQPKRRFLPRFGRL